MFFFPTHLAFRFVIEACICYLVLTRLCLPNLLQGNDCLQFKPKELISTSFIMQERLNEEFV